MIKTKMAMHFACGGIGTCIDILVYKKELLHWPTASVFTVAIFASSGEDPHHALFLNSLRK